MDAYLCVCHSRLSLELIYIPTAFFPLSSASESGQRNWDESQCNSGHRSETELSSTNKTRARYLSDTSNILKSGQILGAIGKSRTREQQ